MTEQQATLMNKKICSLALGLAILSLTGCGLKGPLYFPPADNSANQTPEQRQQAREKAQQDAAAQQSMEETSMPDRNDHGLVANPTSETY